MSFFKTQWIVLQVWKYSEKELFYKMLFRDYWILTVKKKKKVREKPIDIWYLVSCEIVTHNEKKVHTIGNIRIKCFFISEGKSYHQIESFLRLTSKIKAELPEWSPHYEIYDIFSKYIEHCEHYSLLLTHLKIIQCLWTLPDTDGNSTTQKILKFIHSHHYKNILRLTDIPEDIQKKLEQML